MIQRERGKILNAFKGTVIVREGTADKWAYQIVRGRAEVYTERAGKRVVLARLGPGQFFGEMGLVMDAPRTASVLATDDCILRVITRRTFDRLVSKNPKSIVPLITMLFERLRVMNLKYLMALESQTSDVPSRRSAA